MYVGEQVVAYLCLQSTLEVWLAFAILWRKTVTAGLKVASVPQ